MTRGIEFRGTFRFLPAIFTADADACRINRTKEDAAIVAVSDFGGWPLDFQV